MNAIDALIDLAVTIGVEGWEGRPIGALFVIGDSNKVMENSRPPFTHLPVSAIGIS